MIAYPTYDGKVYVVLCQDRRMEISLTPTEAREIGRAMIWAARLALEFRHKHQDSFHVPMRAEMTDKSLG